MGETLEEFFQDRAPWFAINPVETPEGAWQIALTIDGNYFSKDLAHDMADYWAERMLGLFVERAKGLRGS